MVVPSLDKNGGPSTGSTLKRCSVWSPIDRSPRGLSTHNLSRGLRETSWPKESASVSREVMTEDPSSTHVFGVDVICARSVQGH